MRRGWGHRPSISAPSVMTRWHILWRKHTTLLLTEGPTRAQDERVKAFAARHTKKLTCFDTKEYALPGISDEFRPLLSPVVMAAVLQRISKNIEVITDHSLDIRRYYRKESY